MEPSVNFLRIIPRVDSEKHDKPVLLKAYSLLLRTQFEIDHVFKFSSLQSTPIVYIYCSLWPANAASAGILLGLMLLHDNRWLRSFLCWPVSSALKISAVRLKSINTNWNLIKVGCCIYRTRLNMSSGYWVFLRLFHQWTQHKPHLNKQLNTARLCRCIHL